jgi:hypothetical protein
VAYAYEKGYTAGQTADRFNPGARIEFRHYVTFLLRALGYNDKAGDFTFATSLDKAVEIGMMDRASADLILREGVTFYRSDLTENGITDVNEIEFTLTVSDYENWDAVNLLDKTFTYQH